MLTMSPDHVYTLTHPDGSTEVLPSNTQILQDRGCINSDWFTPESAQRGTDVHLLTSEWDKIRVQGLDWDWETVDPRYKGYCEAWRKFCTETGFMPILNEHMLWHSSGYATTIDRFGTIGSRFALVEIKTGRPSKWVCLQMALQELALLERFKAGDVELPGFPKNWKASEMPLKVAIWLKPDGKYQVFDDWFRPHHYDDARSHVRSYFSARECR